MSTTEDPGLAVRGVVESSGGTIIADGYVDIGTADELLRAAVDVLERGVTGVLTVDLAGVSFLDSAGITSLVKIRHECDERGWSVTVVGASGSVRRVVVDLMGLGDFLNVATD